MTESEALSGVPIEARIALAAGRPLLTVEHTNRLLQRHGLARALAEAVVHESVAATVALTPEEEHPLIRAALEPEGVEGEEALVAWLERRGWSFDDVLPFFRKSEDYQQKGDPSVRGQGGPLKVEDYRTILPLTHQFVKAAQEAGFPFNPDLNGRQRSGVGYSQMTRRGRWRGSTAPSPR